MDNIHDATLCQATRTKQNTTQHDATILGSVIINLPLNPFKLILIALVLPNRFDSLSKEIKHNQDREVTISKTAEEFISPTHK